MKKNNIELERLALGLLEYETLNGEEIKIIVEGGSLSRNENDDDVAPTPRQKRPRTGLPTGRKSRKQRLCHYEQGIYYRME